MFKLDTKHNLPLEYYPPASARGQAFEQQAHAMVLRTDAHQPSQRLQQQMDKAANKNRKRIEQEERKARGDAKRVRHVMSQLLARGQGMTYNCFKFRGLMLV